MNTQSFWEKLKQRNVPRVAAFYAGSAWLLVQVATQVFPFFDVPNWAVRLIVIAAILGFPFALAISWFYELTPQGLKRESEMAADASIPRSSGRKMDHAIIAVLALAVVLLVADLFVTRAPPAPAKTSDTNQSVAVLPFENLSDDKSNSYFAQGIQDEILTRLSKIGSLHVISRTSTARYASNPDDLPIIAKHLGVDHVLEGSVQKSGDTVHINVQLIRAATDEHLWAETYDRKLDNIFSVEGEVAQAIAEAMNARLTGAEHQAISEAPTRSASAYDLYLHGLAAELRFSRRQDLLDAANYYRDAVKADPAFALAWAHLSIVISNNYFNGVEHTVALLQEMRDTADTAMRLQPELGEAWLAKGYYQYRGENDFDAAIASFEQAGRRQPSNAEVTAAIAYVQRRQGKWQQSLDHLTAATRLDPQNSSYWYGIAEIDQALRRYPEAVQTIDRVMEIKPGSNNDKGQKAQYFQEAGDLDAAQGLIDTLPADDHDMAVLFGLQYMMRHQFVPMSAALERALDPPDLRLGDQLSGIFGLLGASYLFAGNAPAAQAAFERGRKFALDLRAQGGDTPDLASNLGLIEAGLGNREEALREGRRGVELTGKDVWHKATQEYVLAEILALVGNRGEALSMLERLVDVPNGGVGPGELRFNPVWDSLRSDIRFDAVLQRAMVPVNGPSAAHAA